MGFLSRFGAGIRSSLKGWSASDYGGYASAVANDVDIQGGWRGFGYQFYQDWAERGLDILQGAGDSGSKYDRLSRLALQNPFGQSCVRKISETLGEIELEAYKLDSDGSRLVKPNHGIFELLHGPMGERSPLAFMEPVVMHLHFAGELFVYRPRAWSDGGRPMALELIEPSRFVEFIRKRVNEPYGFVGRTIRRDTWEAMPDGSVVGYRFNGMSGSGGMFRRFDRVGVGDKFVASVENMLHVKRYNPWKPMRGLPLIEGAHMSLVQATMATKWNTNLGKSGGLMVGLFVPEGLKPGDQLTVEQRDRIEKDLDGRLKDRQERNLPMVMSGAMRYLPNNVTPRDADFLEGDKYNGRKICAVFRVPPILAGDVDSVGLGGGSGVRSAEKLFMLTAALPLLDSVLTELNQGVMRLFPGGWKLGYNRAKIESLQEDLEKLFKRLSAGCGGAFLTPNDARVMAGMEKLTGKPEYDEIRKGKGKEGKEDEDNDGRNDRERDDASNNNNERAWLDWATGIINQ